MDDLEITKACAEAMGFRMIVEDGDLMWDADMPEWYAKQVGRKPQDCDHWDPLHDDAQCFALVKLLKPANLSYNVFAGKWSVHTLRDNETGKQFEAFDDDINRAICECVAKMAQSQNNVEAK